MVLRMLKRLAFISFALAASALLLVSALKEHARHAQEVKGTVWEVLNSQDAPERWTLAPLRNAEVMTVWDGAGPGTTVTLHSGGHCMGHALSRTGADGAFHFPAWKAPWGVAVGEGVAYAYAEGFVEVTSFNSGMPARAIASGQHLMRRAAPGETPDRREGKFPVVDACPQVLH